MKIKLLKTVTQLFNSQWKTIMIYRWMLKLLTFLAKGKQTFFII